jgi:hypothetical protein
LEPVKITFVTVDLEVSPRTKRALLRVALPAVLLLGAGGVAYASLPHTFASGEVLTAANLNNNLQSLDTRVTALEAATVTVVTATSPTPTTGNYYVTQEADCAAGQRALGGGAMFTDASGTIKGGMLMSSFPVGSPPTGWQASGSIQYGTAGDPGASDRLQVYVVCTNGL